MPSESELPLPPGSVAPGRQRNLARSTFSASNDGAFDAATAMLSPVRGFRPDRAGRLFVENVPNPVTDTVSSFARASPMTSNTALTALFA